jgi:hypothetical protein
MTFAQIRDSLTPNINRLMRYYRYVEVDIPDMMAHGFMRLWEQLVDQPWNYPNKMEWARVSS